MSETTQTQDSSYESNENLIGKAIANETVDQSTEENIGIIIESPPRFDAEEFVDILCSNARYDVGLGMVSIDEADIDDLQSRTEDSSVRLTDKVSVAVNWRNGTETGFEWDGRIEPEKLVILVRGDHARLNSMKDFEGMVDLPLAEITREITDQMQAQKQFADSPQPKLSGKPLAPTSTIGSKSLQLLTTQPRRSKNQNKVHSTPLEPNSTDCGCSTIRGLTTPTKSLTGFPTTWTSCCGFPICRIGIDAASLTASPKSMTAKGKNGNNP